MSFYTRPKEISQDDFGPGLFHLNSDAYINLEATGEYGTDSYNMVCEWNDEIAPFPTVAEIQASANVSSWFRIRTERNKRLVETDWHMHTDVPGDKDAWATYRQALRDIPQTQGDGTQNDGYADDEGNWHYPVSTGSITVVWPTPPA